jgi:Protein of unknown function (DUF4238)
MGDNGGEATGGNELAERSKRHHYVPQAILNGFARDGQIATVDLKGGEYVQAVRKAAAENDYNTVLIDDGEKSDIAERLIAETIEGPAHRILSRIVEGGWIETDSERLDLSRYLVFQSFRTPRQRRMFDELTNQTLKFQMAIDGPRGLQRAVGEAENRNITDEEAAELWDSVKDFDDYTVKPPPQDQLMLSLEMVDEFAPFVQLRFNWGLIRFKQRGLLTSDSPLLIIRNKNLPDYLGTGLLTAGGIGFAIGRRTALLLTPVPHDGVSVDGRINPSVVLAREINGLSVHSALRFVFHHPHDDLAHLLGPDFELPEPRPAELDFGGSDDLRDQMKSMNEWHFANPDQPHPMSGKDPDPEVKPWHCEGG